MAAVELPEVTRESYPYRAIGLLSVKFPNGQGGHGTFSVVGRNDILTATHMVFDPDKGGWATEIELWAGVDYNSVTGRWEDIWLRDQGSYRWTVSGWTNQVYADGSNATLTHREAQFDVALIGLSWPIGDTTGWLGLSSGYNNPLTAISVGYPATGTGMMRDYRAVSRSDPSAEVYIASGISMGPGSSGGPLFTNDNYVIGVKTSSGGGQEVWADIGHLYSKLADLKVENDSLLPDFPQKGTARAAEVFVFRSEKTGSGPASYSYFYTSNPAEANNIKSRPDWPWVQKTSSFEAAHSNMGQSVPLYRFWSDKHQSHFFTASAAERDEVIAFSATGRNGYDWRFEGEGFRVYRSDAPVDVAGYDAVPVYRIWMDDKDRNPGNGSSGGHYYTGDVDEYNTMIKLVGNVGEGIAFYGEHLG